jgi:hypothetical protein
MNIDGNVLSSIAFLNVCGFEVVRFRRVGHLYEQQTWRARECMLCRAGLSYHCCRLVHSHALHSARKLLLSNTINC